MLIAILLMKMKRNDYRRNERGKQKEGNVKLDGNY
jgi:hypothetical protein